ncbi:MAG: UbiA family prenyltransferase, partial [Candidatus Hermodarchaeota archaeon]|nr:UbiA family prenyltransferase [Candidatus Hermodarchaeota archaeon]
MSIFFDQGVILLLIILFFASGAYLLRRGLLGQWRYHYDYIIFTISGCIFTAGSVMTLLKLQVGHPYLELLNTNPLLMTLLWVFILPPINPLATVGFSVGFFVLAGVQRVFPPPFIRKRMKTSTTPRPIKIYWLRYVGKMVRVDVWLGSLFLVVLAFLILGGPPLSRAPLPLSDIWMWGRLLIALLAAGLFNSCVFIVNQLGDYDTDQLHQEKSQLPLSAGQFTRRQGVILALTFLSLGVPCALIVGIPYLILLAAIIMFGLIYSLPPIRLKARPFIDLIIIGVAFGAWAVLAAWVILFFLPEIPLILIVGACLFYAGTHGIHTASDYDADAAAGVKTT